MDIIFGLVAFLIALGVFGGVLKGVDMTNGKYWPLLQAQSFFISVTVGLLVAILYWVKTKAAVK